MSNGTGKAYRFFVSIISWSNGPDGVRSSGDFVLEFLFPSVLSDPRSDDFQAGGGVVLSNCVRLLARRMSVVLNYT